jgi:hypothetical protein
LWSAQSAGKFLRGQGCVTAGPSAAILGDIMSRGHGKWERLILQAVETLGEDKGFYLMSLLPNDPSNPGASGPSKAAVRALRRAASNLIDKGLVDFWYDKSVVEAYVRQTGGRTRRRPHRLVIARPGYLHRKAVAQR